MTEWLESIYQILSRLWDYMTYVYEYINSMITYVFIVGSNVVDFCAAFPTEIYLAIALSVAVCIFLFVLGR